MKKEWSHEETQRRGEGRDERGEGSHDKPLGWQLHCRPVAGEKEWQYNCHPNELYSGHPNERACAWDRAAGEPAG